MPLGIAGFTYADLHAPARLRDLHDLFCRDVASRNPALWAEWDAYRRDPEINEAVCGVIASDKRFADTSVWLTTSRRWVRLEGCVRTSAQRASLVKLVGAQPRVERVFDELRVR